ncbi:MAG: YhgE/Pip family protein [Clostridium sp.]
MNNILKVFTRDIKKTVRNPIAIIIVVALCLLPSLYAWVNIKACWDPYENTGKIPVAIVNEDEGAEIQGKSINVGRELEESLKNNKKIGWDFVSEKNGEMGLVDGSYYAMIKIPKDFSSSLTSITTDTPRKPELIYKVNRKVTPVAEKITEAAEEQIVNEITKNFINSVNKTLFEELNLVGSDLDSKKEEIKQFRRVVIYLSDNLDKITSSLDNTSLESEVINKYLLELQQNLKDINGLGDKLQDGNNNKIDQVTALQGTINNALENINIILNGINSEVVKLNNTIDELINNSTDKGNETVVKLIGEAQKSIDIIDARITSLINYLEKTNINNSPNINTLIAKLKESQSILKEQKVLLEKLEKNIIDKNELSGEILKDINNLNLKLIKNTNDEIILYNDKVKPEINIIGNNLVDILKTANVLIEDSKKVDDDIRNILSLGIDGSELARKSTNDLSTTLKEFSPQIKFLGEALKEVDENDIISIISILQSRPELIGDFISEPINIVEKPIYEVPNYGSAMTPIYSVLALWVGGLMLISILKVNPPKFDGDEDITITQKYLGKLLFFVLLGFMQGLIVALGDVLILGVYSTNPIILVLISSFIGIIFNIIIYTLMSVFGNIGKAISIILMVVQLAGCGGTYPIQLDPEIFRILQPFFPFTYGVGAYREAIAGILPWALAIDLVILFIYGVAFVLIGILLKKRLYKKIESFEKSFEESGLGE